MMKVDSTICGRLASARWNAEAMFGSAGSIMSIASGFSAMMDAMMTTNSGKPIGRWPEETQALALISDTYDLASGRDSNGNAALHNAHSGMAARRGGMGGRNGAENEPVGWVERSETYRLQTADTLPSARRLRP